jgi:hypothetical protein
MNKLWKIYRTPGCIVFQNPAGTVSIDLSCAFHPGVTGLRGGFWSTHIRKSRDGYDALPGLFRRRQRETEE